MNDDLAPPVLLDSARVLQYAETGGDASFTHRKTMIVDGEILGPVPRMAICEDLVEGTFLLMHCNSSWSVLAASYYSSIEAAKESAECAYVGISSGWRACHELSEQECREVEERRQSLRELAALYPIDRGPHAA